MSKIFITNGTGYIGSAVARLAREKGHDVTALARSEEAAAILQEHGIKAHRGDLRQPQSYADAVRNAEIVIHTAATNDADYGKVDAETVNNILDALRGTNKTFVYTSGVWVLGNTGEQPANEETKTNPFSGIEWRPVVEQKVIAAQQQGIRTVVIRPGVVYGHGGGIVGRLYSEAKKNGEVSYIGNGENRWSVVHVDDVARLYVLAVEKALAGSILHATGEETLKQREVAELVAKSAGVPGKVRALPIEEARKRIGFVADGLAIDQNVLSTVTKRLLGWAPQSPQLNEDLSRN